MSVDIVISAAKVPETDMVGKVKVPLVNGRWGNGVLEPHCVLGMACERRGPILSFLYL